MLEAYSEDLFDTLKEMKRDGSSADEIVKQEAHKEELGVIIAKVRAALGLN